MKRQTKTAILLIQLTLHSILIRRTVAQTEENQYSLIWERNIFNLKSQVVETNLPKPAETPARIVKLVGLAAFPPDRWAVLLIEEKGKKQWSLVLKEGCSRSNILVIEVNPRERWVRLENDGTISTVLLEKARPSLPPPPPPDPAHPLLPVLPPPGSGDI